MYSADNPKVSVIVPVYNAEKYISNLIKDLEAQTYASAEYLLINDGSTDDTVILVYDLIRQNGDKRFKFINKQNGGVSSARNMGLDIATGEYIVFVDSDDRLVPNFLESYVASIQRHHSDMEFFSAIKVSDSTANKTVGGIDYTPISSSTAISVRKMIAYFGNLQAWGYPFCFISKRALWRNVRFDTGIAYQEDVLALFMVWTSFPDIKIYVNKNSYYYYVMNNQSALHNMKPSQYWQFVEVDDRILEMVDKVFDRKTVKKLRALKISSLMNVVVASLLYGDNDSYTRARKMFINYFSHAMFSRTVLKRRIVQLFLLRLNLRPILKATYRRIWQ